MKISSPLVGELEVAPDRIIEFSAGLPGFEKCTRFTLVHEEGHEPTVFLLQSLDEPSVAFSLATPDKLGLNYEFELTDDEVASLGATGVDDLVVAVILRRDEQQPLSANLMAPLVINAATRRGVQKVIGRIGCDVTLRAL